MKKILLTFGLLACCYLNAQTTIVEEKFEKDNVPLGYNFLPVSNEIVIQKGKHVAVSQNRMINNLNRYNKSGEKKVLLQNEEVMKCVFYADENTFTVDEYSKMSYSAKNFKIVSNGKSSPLIKADDWNQFYKDNNGFSILDKKNSHDFNYEKDEIFLSITDNTTRKNSKIKIEKPDLLRLKGENAAKYAKELKFTIRSNNNNFELITKSISKDYKTTTLYRTIYDFQGRKTEDLSYSINVQDGFLMYCNNGGHFVFTGQGLEENFFYSDLSINNFVVDSVTDEIYVYGLYGANNRKSNVIANEPLGFYIFKFDRKGNKIWESINPISDANFNSSQTITKLFASLNVDVRKNEIIFSTGPKLIRNEFLSYFLLDKKTGKINKKNKISYLEDNIHTMMTGDRMFLKAFYTNRTLAKKAFDDAGLLALEMNDSFASYIKSINNKAKLFFNTMFTKDGIWLIESDNETYYKVTYFNN